MVRGETPRSKQGQPARFLWSLAWLVLCLLSPLVHAEEIYLDLQASGEGSYTVKGRFWTPGDSLAAWSTLIDYERLPQFVPGLEFSHVQERYSDHLLLKQEAVGRALFFFHRHLDVLLNVQEQWGRQISFLDISHKDFDAYSGYWQVAPAAGGGSWVDYRLEAKPNFFAPHAIARKAFRSNAKDLLLSVQSEIIRRGKLGETLLCCSQPH